ncbi:3845_t:CDS:1, partial [Dentiscutata heterogama]
MHLVGFRAMADNINKLACLTLPREPENPEPIISIAVDHINDQELDAVDNDCNFRQLTNLPATLILQIGARVMYLDNDLFEHSLFNGSIGVITDLIDENTINVVFPTPLRMITAV